MLQNQRTRRAAQTAEPDAPMQSTRSRTPRPGAGINLRSLAPEYKEHQHATYVRHLKVAVTEPRNKNIALTGRYGSGKSSILDEFLDEQEKEHHKKILRISINTLGPDDDEDLTNRIQKELVKQLVYRAEPGEIRRSRFARRKDLTWWRSLRDGVAVGIVVVGLLWLFGVRPDADALGAGRAALSTAALLVLVVGSAWGVRWVIGNRPVSQFSTGGTSISFEEQPDSYFDEYLDEIMAFFDAKEPDFVVFEDLDRFDDPRIFDSLRELNTLINASAHWKKREKRPLRFIYAIKDSLFEKLGEDPQDTDRRAKEAVTQGDPKDGGPEQTAEPTSKKRRDAAKAAVERANRTKFFEIVVPVVPFLSHSNARDLLSRALKDLELPKGTEISRELLDLVARHATDMRLLINICNEFVVYAERLLWIPRPAPSMTANDLFALVVYKNFHLADFEALPHRGSALDALELKRRDVVRESIAQLQQDKRELLRVDRLQNDQDRIAHALGDRLMMLPHATNHSLVSLSTGEQVHDPDSVHQSAFWRDVAAARELSMDLRHRSGHRSKPSFDYKQLEGLFPEGMDPVRWREPDAEELAAQRASIDRDVAALRGAGFADLAVDRRFKSSCMTFDEHLENVLDSELARDLVRRGFVDRYYAEYSAVFYGDFLGVDVANFFRNCVWPNEMDVQFEFTTPNAVGNLLEQAPAGFVSSRSVFNIQIVDHMLEHRPGLAEEFVAFFVAEQGDDAHAFLNAFLNAAESRKAELVGFLAAHPWRGLFDHLALRDSVPDEVTRTALLDAALLSARDAGLYDLGEKARELIVDRHTDLAAFLEDQEGDRSDVVFSFVRRTELSMPSLRPLSDGLRRRVVEEGVYVLTADNLRAALGLGDAESIELDRIRQDHAVWRRCTDDADGYLDAVDQDNHTPYSVLTATVLSDVIEERHEKWTDEQLARVLGSSAPEAAVPDLAQVPRTVWPAIAAARRMVPSVGNLHAYAKAVGVDEHLARVLVVKPGIPVEMEDLEDAERDVIHHLMVQILNASEVLESSDRVSLALQLDPEPRPDAIELTDLQPSGDDLLADLLEAGLVPDTAATFEHFLTAGWRSVSKAFEVSEAAHEFLSPELVAGHVLDLLRDPLVPRAIKEKVVADLGAYATEGDREVLREAASFAHKRRIRLPLLQVEWAAPHVSDPEQILWQLASMGDGLDGDVAIRVLGLLGGDYEGFNGDSGRKFDVPVTDSIRIILERLRASGLVELPRGGPRGRKKVELV